MMREHVAVDNIFYERFYINQTGNFYEFIRDLCRWQDRNVIN